MNAESEKTAAQRVPGACAAERRRLFIFQGLHQGGADSGFGGPDGGDQRGAEDHAAPGSATMPKGNSVVERYAAEVVGDGLDLVIQEDHADRRSRAPAR